MSLAHMNTGGRGNTARECPPSSGGPQPWRLNGSQASPGSGCSKTGWLKCLWRSRVGLTSACVRAGSPEDRSPAPRPPLAKSQGTAWDGEGMPGVQLQSLPGRAGRGSDGDIRPLAVPTASSAQHPDTCSTSNPKSRPGRRQARQI